MGHRFTPAAHAHPTAPVLIGRDSERLYLREELAAALAGQGRLVLIGGEAGIGKTSLAREVAAEAAARGTAVLAGYCYDLTNTPPFGPWLELFADYRAEQGPAPPKPFADGRLRGTISDQAALFAEVRDFFAALTALHPALVILEDLHWADPASIELLRYLGAHLARLPLLVLVTYRTDELTRHHPFARQLPALIRDATGLRLDLKQLSEAELSQLVAAQFALAEADERRLVRYLADHAEGNPFFATELLRALREADLLRPAGDGWSLGEIDRLVMPQLLAQVIESRIARHGEEVRGQLAIAAVIGHDIPLDLWAEVGQIDEETLYTIVEQAVEAHLMEAELQGMRVRFVHALTREALYQSLLPPRRRAWHRRVADILAAHPDPDPDAVAAHLQRAEDPRAPDWLTRAGDRAQRAYALLTAVERFRAAATLLDGVAGQERPRALLLYRLARLQRFSTPAAGVADLDAAAQLATAAGDEILAAEARYSRGLLLAYADDFEHGIPEMDANISKLETFSDDMARELGGVEAWLADALPTRDTSPKGDDGLPPLRSVNGIHHRRGGHVWFMARGGYLEEAQQTGEAFVSRITPGQLTGSLLTSAAGHAYQGLGLVAAARGRPVAARAAFAQSYTCYEAIDHHAVVAFSLLQELRDVAIPYFGDDPELRHRLAAEAAAALARAQGAVVPGLSPRLATLSCLVLAGRWEEAKGLIQHLPPPGNCHLRREVTTTTAELAHYQGEPDLAREAIGAILRHGQATAPGTTIFQEGLLLQRLAADIAIDTGDFAEAQAWLAANDRWLAWNGAVLGQAEGRLGWARFHFAQGDVARAHALATAALTQASEPRQPLALLAVHRLLGQIALKEGNEREAEAQLQAALALADACAVPFERAITLLARAECRLSQGRSNEARALLTEAETICASLHAQPTLATINEIARRIDATPRREPLPLGLTAREAEVLRLLAQGLTDAGIAERLYISPRTVGQHLRSIYAKLDVSTRVAATRLAIEHGLA